VKPKAILYTRETVELLLKEIEKAERKKSRPTATTYAIVQPRTR
jgi:hypothetical protein